MHALPLKSSVSFTLAKIKRGSTVLHAWIYNLWLIHIVIECFQLFNHLRNKNVIYRHSFNVHCVVCAQHKITALTTIEKHLTLNLSVITVCLAQFYLSTCISYKAFLFLGAHYETPMSCLGCSVPPESACHLRQWHCGQLMHLETLSLPHGTLLL